MPHVRPVEHPRGDRRPRRAAPASRRGGRRGRAPVPLPMPRTRPRPSDDRWASASSIACSAAAWWPARSSCWVASRASASRRSCSRSRPGSPRGDGAVRDRRGVGGAGPAARRPPRADQRTVRGTRSGSSPRPASDRIAELARADRPGLLVVDSVQTVASDELDGPPGSVGQVREAALRLMELAKAEGIPVVLVGHVTKDGTLAGPKTLEHLVDVVLSVEGDRTGGLRLVRATKNRYGSTEEVGVFEMADARPDRGRRPGPRVPRRPRRAGAGQRGRAGARGLAPAAGRGAGAGRAERCAVAATDASGVDANRLALLVAVLGRRAGIGLSGHDVYANLAGGLTVAEPGLDLPLALALASSLRDRPLVDGTVAIGEVGLLGELRPVGGPRPPAA